MRLNDSSGKQYDRLLEQLTVCDWLFLIPSSMDQDISSTKVRLCLSHGRPIDHLVDPLVADYLHLNELGFLNK